MRARGPNERLKRAMSRAGYTIEALAEASGFHPKQVGRWLAEGVVPRRTGAKALVAELLDVEEDDIWPVTPTSVAVEPQPVTADLVEVWAHRADVPKARWWGLLSAARHRIDLMAYALSFLREDHPGLDGLLGEKVADGCDVRIVLADPTSRHVRDRDAEQGLEGQLGKLILRDLKSLRDQPPLRGIDLRTHGQCLYTSVFRADDQLFSTPHLFGLPGWATPLYHLRRRREGGLFDAVVDHFDRVWKVAEPVASGWPASRARVATSARCGLGGRSAVRYPPPHIDLRVNPTGTLHALHHRAETGRDGTGREVSPCRGGTSPTSGKWSPSRFPTPRARCRVSDG